MSEKRIKMSENKEIEVRNIRNNKKLIKERNDYIWKL